MKTTGKGGEKKTPVEVFEEQRKALLDMGGLEEKDCTVGMGKANLYGIITALPFTAAVILAYVFGGKGVFNIVSQSIDVIIFAAALIVSIPVHEGLHGLFWAISRGSFKGIRFGIVLRALTPYCACAYPCNRAQYFTGLIAPFVILTAGFAVAACLTGYWALAAAAAANALLAGGDLFIALRLVFSKGKYFLDHPQRCGFIAFEKTKREDDSAL